MEINSVPWAKPDFGLDEKKAIQRVVDSEWMTMGKETEQFEKELAKYLDKKHVVVVNSGTNAIIAALLSHRSYHKGYTVRIPSYTFKATENAVYASGLKDIKYGEVCPMTGLMEPKQSDKRYEIQVPVHYAGLPINPTAWDETPLVVEDAAESFGMAIRRNSDNIVYGDRLTCYSFHAAKNITMIEGGCIATDNSQLAYRLKSVRCHGEDPKNKGHFLGRGLNMKPLDICSAVGRVQLKKIDRYLRNRFEVATLYRDQLRDIVEFQHIPDYVERHANMMFPVYVDKPMQLAEYLKKKRIGFRLGWKPLKSTPGSEYMYKHVLCLPMFNTMTMNEAYYVVEAVTECLT